MNTHKRVFGNELKYLQEVLETDFVSSRSSVMVNRLEKAFAERFESNFAISHINGTATMHSLLEAMNIGPGDEVIVPPLTMSATTLAVLHANAVPVFADVDAATFLIDPQSIRERITEKTRAIIVVSLYGLSPDMDAIMDIAERHNLFVIEDNAQCFLGTYRGKLVGTLGHAASYSFQNSKHITSGEGGMVTTNSEDLANKVRRANSLGYSLVGAKSAKITKKDIQDPKFARHSSLGWNYRMPELCAAVALAQMENLEVLVQKRVDAATLFEEAVRDCDWLQAQYIPDDCTSSYWSFVAKLDHPSITWYEFRDKFQEMGGDDIYSAWQLTYLEPLFETMSLQGRELLINEKNKRQYKRGLCPVAEELQPKLLQFKTNYWDTAEAEQQADILRRTIAALDVHAPVLAGAGR